MCVCFCLCVYGYARRGCTYCLSTKLVPLLISLNVLSWKWRRRVIWLGRGFSCSRSQRVRILCDIFCDRKEFGQLTWFFERVCILTLCFPRQNRIKIHEGQLAQPAKKKKHPIVGISIFGLLRNLVWRTLLRLQMACKFYGNWATTSPAIPTNPNFVKWRHKFWCSALSWIVIPSKIAPRYWNVKC